MSDKGNPMNGLRVFRTEGTIFIPLPRELRRDCGGCTCDFCKKHPGRRPSWDTLALAADGEGRRSDHAWTVHYPELHPVTANDLEISPRAAIQRFLAEVDKPGFRLTNEHIETLRRGLGVEEKS